MVEGLATLLFINNSGKVLINCEGRNIECHEVQLTSGLHLFPLLLIRFLLLMILS